MVPEGSGRAAALSEALGPGSSADVDGWLDAVCCGTLGDEVAPAPLLHPARNAPTASIVSHDRNTPRRATRSARIMSSHHRSDGLIRDRQMMSCPPLERGVLGIGEHFADPTPVQAHPIAD